MTYYIYDEDGYVGDLASGGGLEQLQDFIDLTGGHYLRQLFIQGSASKSPEIEREISALPEPADPDVSSSLVTLKKLVAKCNSVIIITDGVGIEESET